MVTAMDGSSSMIGSIDLKCEISPIISQAYMAARDICEYHYMTAPELDYRYIISSLKYVIFQHFAKKNGKNNLDLQNTQNEFPIIKWFVQTCSKLPKLAKTCPNMLNFYSNLFNFMSGNANVQTISTIFFM